jgi:hypothetical protein
VSSGCLPALLSGNVNTVFQSVLVVSAPSALSSMTVAPVTRCFSLAGSRAKEAGWNAGRTPLGLMLVIEAPPSVLTYKVPLALQ